MKKTYKEFDIELDEILGFAARKKLGRRLKLLAKRASTKFKKARNRLKQISIPKAKLRAGKAVRKFFMQKIAGKGKDISNLPFAQKERLEVLTNKKMKGGKGKALVKRFMKKIMKKHRDNVIKAKEAKKAHNAAETKLKKIK